MAKYKNPYAGTLHRAKTKDGKVWVYGEFKKIGKSVVMDVLTTDDGKCTEIDEFTVCLWTGKTDDINTKVFSFDILAQIDDNKDGETDFGVINIDAKGNPYCLHEYNSTGNIEHPLASVDFKKWRVIGNVFDNGADYGFEVKKTDGVIFRGKTTDGSKVWVTGRLVKKFGQNPVIAVSDQDKEHYVAVDSMSIGQCTGYKDNRDKTVFENDIVERSDNNGDLKGKVAWDHDDRFIILGLDPDVRQDIPVTESVMKEWTVIGNEFENGVDLGYIDHIPVTELIANMDQLKENIRTFDNYIKQGTWKQKDWAKKSVLNGICFIVYTVENEVRFAPSRFVGYVNNSITEHKLSYYSRNGRETNVAISKILDCNLVIDDTLLRGDYFKYCMSIGIEKREKGSYGVLKKFWNANVVKLTL